MVSMQGMSYEGIGYMLPPNSALHNMPYMGMPREDTTSICHVNRSPVLRMKMAPYSSIPSTFPVDSFEQTLYDVVLC